ncbi:F0F1 ATP synthase subunit delta [Mesomycoplasma ovipneumoniae]|uniref:F0F1 ATP synthase subunit delta n=1 Tax=Mesomycoplasma ovipneumoniae TaxID=29562 RepID=UPI00083E8EBA|nr:F0F1 ATP synthase subunit delta [Mesomycoplasma ovipneumoniae]MCP9306633.1 F0F1 ATP synthase subunit delta [Mesomycoplasma ovipneumoniae]
MHPQVKNIYGYSESLLEISISEKKVDQFINDSFYIIDLVSANPSLISIFASHFISKSEKYTLIEKIFESKIDTYMINFLKVICKNNLFSHYNQILIKYIKLANAYLGQSWGQIQSAFPLSPSEIAKFEDLISQKLNKKIVLRPKINPKLISGIKITIDNHVFEHSLSSQLRSLKQKLIKNI